MLKTNQEHGHIKIINYFINNFIFFFKNEKI